MKGMVFTEFLELVEQLYGLNMVDDVIEESDLPSQGAYTAVGTYDHRELLSMVQVLSRKTNTLASELITAFGRHLFPRILED